MTAQIRLKRIYDEPGLDDGFRVFVDRLWARGIAKEVAKIDLWPKELTPSTDLRKWFHEPQSRHAEFEKRYRSELEGNLDAIQPILRTLREHSTITLVTATKDLVDGHSAVLKAFLKEKLCHASQPHPDKPSHSLDR